MEFGNTGMSGAIAYLNGRIIPAVEARLPVYDTGVVLGATVSEQTRTFRLRPFRLDDHLARLFRSLDRARLDIVLTKADLAAISLELVEHNGRLLEEGDELGIIQFVTAGEYATYAGMSGSPARTTPTVCVHTYRLPFELWAHKMRIGAHLMTPSIRQVPAECYSPQMKCRSRMHFYLADQEARQRDPEAFALLLDLKGNVTETNAANFLIVEDGTIVSPCTRDILPGISRGMIIELAGQLGVPFAERDIPPARIKNAQEAFLTSTPYCLMPVTKINGAAIGTGQPGSLTRRLLAAWSKVVGLDIEQQIIDGATRHNSPQSHRDHREGK
jgi:branched-subunit amino acid aminotransferase/4-amino-4-deoxychorismate lyase